MLRRPLPRWPSWLVYERSPGLLESNADGLLGIQRSFQGPVKELSKILRRSWNCPCYTGFSRPPLFSTFWVHLGPFGGGWRNLSWFLCGSGSPENDESMCLTSKRGQSPLEISRSDPTCQQPVDGMVCSRGGGVFLLKGPLKGLIAKHLSWLIIIGQ